jgi:O-antigen ligase
LSLTGVFFLVAFATGCLLALARHPVYGLLTYVAVFYLNPQSRWWGQDPLMDLRWSLIAAAFAVLSLLIHSEQGRIVAQLKRAPVLAFIAFIGWITLQSFWALDSESHWELLTYYLKFVVVIILFGACVESEQQLRWVLWAHVLGCFYLGWIALNSYTGGRFESFGGAGISEANAAALQIVTGTIVAGCLFLAGSIKERVALFGLIPIIVNGLVTTVSRSGFLAIATGGLVFNYFAPLRTKKQVRLLSVLAVVLFLLVTGPGYWNRIETIKFRGEEVEGVDTGSKRLEIIRQQWKMFRRYPLGCGHMCTTYLSPAYLPESQLSQGGRASHNTFMTLLVDHGVPGAVFYIALVAWAIRQLLSLRRRIAGRGTFVESALPAVTAALGAIFVADQFVQYPKFEARIWFLSLIFVLQQLVAQQETAAQEKPLVSPAATQT